MKGELTMSKEECEKCNKEFETFLDGYKIDTPNYIFNFCLDCAIEVEQELFNKFREVNQRGTN